MVYKNTGTRAAVHKSATLVHSTQARSSVREDHEGESEGIRSNTYCGNQMQRAGQEEKCHQEGQSALVTQVPKSTASDQKLGPSQGKKQGKMDKKTKITNLWQISTVEIEQELEEARKQYYATKKEADELRRLLNDALNKANEGQTENTYERGEKEYESR
jgi:hypothetical protein